MEDPLTYTQRLKLGAISVRKDCADQARRKAVQAALMNDLWLSEMMHAEADQHEAAIVQAIIEMGLTYKALQNGPIMPIMLPPQQSTPMPMLVSRK